MDELPDGGPNEWSLSDLSVGVLEEMLIDLMVVKYPGVEQSDLDRLLHALSEGDLVVVAQIEADIAEKSAEWMRAILRMDY
jgi:hypothetical protein